MILITLHFKFCACIFTGSAKIFKDYAFLLTNADRKIIPKSVEASDSESGKAEGTYLFIIFIKCFFKKLF